MRHNIQWVEAGIEFRSNITTEIGDGVELHSHAYDHVALVTHGWFMVTEITASGKHKQYQLASRSFVPDQSMVDFNPIGYRISIPAGHSHSIKLLGQSNNCYGEWLCFWPAILSTHNISEC